MEVSLRSATPKDIPTIYQLAERIWRTHYTPIIGEKQVEYMLRKMYSPESLEHQMNGGHHFFLASLGTRPLGYVSVSKKTGGEYFLNKFYMEVAEQGKGYGKKVFADMMACFPDLEVMRLQVNRRNFKAVNFYFRLGFIIEDAKDFDIGGGYFMEDFVMVWRSPKAPRG